MTMRNISIAGVTIPIAAPYAEGHTISAREASSLNQTRAENVANNCRKQIKELIEKDGKEAATPAIVKLVQAYDATYDLSTAPVSASRLDPVAREAKAIAVQTVNNHLRASGRKISEFREGEAREKYDAEVARLMETPEIQKAAAKAAALKETATSVKL